MRTPSSVLFLVFGLFAAANCQSWSGHYSSSSEYIHNNDTMKLFLSQSKKNSLHGAPNERVTLEFILKNDGLAGHFTLTARSEDGFMGPMNTNEAYLGPGVQQTIIMPNIMVPYRKNGAKVRLTLTAVRDSGFGKREAEAPPSSGIGGSGSYPGQGVGGSGSYPGGSGVGGSGSYPGGGGSYPGGGGSGVGGSGSYPGGGGSGVGGSGSYPGGGGSGGGGYYPGGGGSGSGGSGSYPGGGGSGGGGGGFYPDPSNRREVSLTVEFTVTTEHLEDDDKPWTKMEYMADSEDQTCKVTPNEAGCENYWWGVKFFAQDEDSGIHLVNVDPIGREPLGRRIYFRHLNFPIGSTQEHEIIAIASCCTQGMKLRVTDVAGVEAELDAEWKGTGDGGLSKTALYGIIGGVAAFVVIVIVVIVAIICRKKYAAVPTH